MALIGGCCAIHALRGELDDNGRVAVPLTSKRRPVGAPSSAGSPRAPEQPSLREIFDEHAAYVLRALRHLGVPEADVPDLSQEVFVTVHRKLADFEGRSSLRTWIYGICLRLASDHRRRAYVRRERQVAEPPDAIVPGAQLSDARIDARNSLLRLLDELDHDKREVVVLYEIEGLGMKEIAELLGCPLQTAYSRLHAARRQILASYAREQGET